jgi:diaminopimelate epimerase
MLPIIFYKMSGCGNDFIIIDNRNHAVNEITELSRFVEKVCRRKMSVGADGLILVEDSDAADFKWRFFNSDGSIAEMCGNGARCVARFAYIKGIAGPEMSFETDAGIISAQVTNQQVKLKMTDPSDLKTNYIIELEKHPLSVSSINTGVPHVVIETDHLDTLDVIRLGREIRFHREFAPAGTNVNFVSKQKDGTIVNRTYERGVEDETLACGTGCVAAALITAYKQGITSPVRVMTRSGGYLSVHYQEKEKQFYNIYLEGDARIIYKGELWEEAWN